MKRVLFVLVLFSWFVNKAQKEKWHPGMSIDEFRQAIPGLINYPLRFNKEINRKENLHGLVTGQWGYFFVNDSLDGFKFIADERLTIKSLNHFIVVMKRVKEEYNVKYGQPLKDTSNTAVLKKIKAGQITNGKISETTWEKDGVLITCSLTVDVRNKSRQQHFVLFFRAKEKQVKEGLLKADTLFIGMHVNRFYKMYPALFPDSLYVNESFLKMIQSMGFWD